MIVRSGEKEFLVPLFEKNIKLSLLAVGKIKDKPEIRAWTMYYRHGQESALQTGHFTMPAQIEPPRSKLRGI